MTESEIVVTAYAQADCLPCGRDAAPLAPDEVSGRTLVTLISAGTELAYFYHGQRFPARPGYAAVFAVEQVGADVISLKPGDQAFCMGPHRSWQRVREDEALPVPPDLNPERAVFARMMGITMTTLTTTSARPPQTVLVTGLGPVGHLAAQTFAACGYEVIACDPSPARREIAERQGITQVLPTVPHEDPLIAKRVALVLECSGHEAAVLEACRMVQPKGEIVLVGVPWQRRTDLYAHDLLHAVFHNYVVLRSGWEWELPRHPAEGRMGSLFENFAAALRWLADGRVRVDGLYAIATPDGAQAVYEDLAAGRGDALAMIFRWSE